MRPNLSEWAGYYLDHHKNCGPTQLHKWIESQLDELFKTEQESGISTEIDRIFTRHQNKALRKMRITKSAKEQFALLKALGKEEDKRRMKVYKAFLLKKEALESDLFWCLYDELSEDLMVHYR